MEATIKFPVLPGDSVFMLDDKKKIIKYVVDKISVLKDGSYIMRISTADVSPSKTQSYEAVCPFELGKTVFLTMEGAIKALHAGSTAKREDDLICFDVDKPRRVSVKDPDGFIHHVCLKLKELKFVVADPQSDDPMQTSFLKSPSKDILARFEELPFTWEYYGNAETFEIVIDPKKVSPELLEGVWRE